MGKTVKRYQKQFFDDDKNEKNAKGRHLKHQINTKHDEVLDSDDDFQYRDEVECFVQKWK